MSVILESIKNPERFTNHTTPTQAELEAALARVLEKIDHNIESFGDKFPEPASRGQVYPLIDNTDWTSCFWTGMLWLVYDATGSEKYREAAEKHLDSFRNRIENQICTDTHDLGFLYSLSCVAAYRLTGNEQAKEIALKAAKELTVRYFPKAGILQAWGNLQDPEQRGRMIIDCCMNLPLLYWASQVTGDSQYADIARSHVKQAEKYIVREDASTYHTYYMDVETGLPRCGKTAQGFSDSSCWSRGQAWGIYGFVLSNIYKQDEELIHSAKKLANYFLNRLPEDLICYWDLVFTEGDEERDSSAAAIAVCGLLELVKQLPKDSQEHKLYSCAAAGMLNSLITNYEAMPLPGSNGLLKHAVYAKPDGKGIDECCIWGDYFYLEALVRCLKDWKLYW